jgi:hypothetical protein
VYRDRASPFPVSSTATQKRLVFLADRGQVLGNPLRPRGHLSGRRCSGVEPLDLALVGRVELSDEELILLFQDVLAIRRSFGHDFASIHVHVPRIRSRCDRRLPSACDNRLRCRHRLDVQRSHVSLDVAIVAGIQGHPHHQLEHCR